MDLDIGVRPRERRDDRAQAWPDVDELGRRPLAAQVHADVGVNAAETIHSIPHDREGLRKALANGIISAICSDHQPHEPDAKLAPFARSEPGISALETLLPLTLRLVDEKLLTLEEAIARLTHQPAQIIGVETGHLGLGATADICIFDPEARWTLIEDRLVSRGHNTPFLGQTFHGQVTHTLVGGKLVYESPPA